MNKEIFSHIPCGQTLPQNNIHAVSVSMPSLQDVIDYEEQTPQILEKITIAYPRFVMHPYLKILAKYIKEKYKISDNYEVVLLSSQKAVEVVSSKYFIHNKIDICEPFGVILVQNGTTQLQKVLKFIQHVGYNLSSRLAEDYLYEVGLLKEKHQEELEDKNSAYDILISNIAKAYKQPKANVCLTPSGMNAVYCALRGLKNIQAKNGKTKLIQLGWLYLDTMNIVEHYFDENKIFYDINDLDSVENYLKELAAYLSKMYRGDSDEILVAINTKGLQFDFDTAIPLGLIVNELVSNAYKHAFKDSIKGNIWIEIQALNDVDYELKVSNNGNKLPLNFDIAKSKSLGLKLVTILSKQLRGSFKNESTNSKTVCVVVFKDLKAFQSLEV